jgi:hypothetical protein
MLLGSDPNTRPYRFKRMKGMKRTEPNQTEITLSVTGQVMVQATGSNLKDAAALEEYLNALDFERIKAALVQ